MNYLYNWYFLSTDFYLIWSSLVLLIFGVMKSNDVALGQPILTKSFYILTLQILFFCEILVVTQTWFCAVLWNGFLFSNFFTYILKLILISFSVIIVSLSYPYLNLQKIHFFEFWILFLLSLVAISLLIHAFDFLSIYISIEFQSLIFYILASFDRTSEFSTEAGLKYFVLGAFASAFLLIGFALLYNLLGITNLLDLAKINSIAYSSEVTRTLILSLLFILTAIFFKLNVAPFHFWSPDVYDGIPFAVTSIFATLPKMALVGLLTKITFISFVDVTEHFNHFLILTCLASSIVGILGAFQQKKWKRFIAYSAIGHSSFILLGVLSNDFTSVVNLFFFLVVYLVNSLLFFIIVSSIYFFRFPTLKHLRFTYSITQINIINKFLAFYLLVTMFSLAGIPPFAGFFSKFFILTTAIKNKFIGVTIIIILLNCLASFYYLRFSKVIYFDFYQSHLFFLPMTKLNSICATFCVVFLSLLVLDLDFLVTVSKLTAFSLIN